VLCSFEKTGYAHANATDWMSSSKAKQIVMLERYISMQSVTVSAENKGSTAFVALQHAEDYHPRK
jgi:hypothetical protein